MILADADIITQVVNWADKLNTIVILTIIVVGAYRKWWVPSWVIKEKDTALQAIIDEKNAWRDTALRASNVATDAFAELRKLS